VNVYGTGVAAIGVANGGVSVNLQTGASLTGTFSVGPGAGIELIGAAGSVLDNVGTSFLGNAAMTIGADVSGSGSFRLSAATIEFAKSVGPHQAVFIDDGLMQIDQPHQFDATVTISSGGPFLAIDLIGLVMADSYTYKNDMLNIYSGNQIIDTLRLHDSTQYGFVVEPPTAGGSVSISAITDPTNPPVGLPVHTGV
jgi:hypothetical protein